MKKYDHIYVNGDSYSARMTNQQVYSDFLRKRLQQFVINQAVIGSNNNRIFRTSIESLIKLRQASPDNEILAIIGISFVTRDEIWYEDNDQKILSKIPDLNHYPESKLITADFLLSDNMWSTAKAILLDLNINRQLTHFYTNLFMFVNTLKMYNIDYLIFSGANNENWGNAQWNYLKSLEMFKICGTDSNIIDLHKFSIPKFAETNNIATTSTGHLLEDGHEKFSQFLLDKLDFKN